MKTAEIFLPPGVEARLYGVLGYCPHRLPVDAAAHIKVLGAIRNAAAEADLDSIDNEMVAIVLREADRLWSAAAALA